MPAGMPVEEVCTRVPAQGEHMPSITDRGNSQTPTARPCLKGKGYPRADIWLVAPMKTWVNKTPCADCPWRGDTMAPVLQHMVGSW